MVQAGKRAWRAARVLLPLTGRGWIALGVFCGLYGYGARVDDCILQIVSFTGFVYLGFSALSCWYFTLMIGAGSRIRQPGLSLPDLECGAWRATGFRLRGVRWLPVTIQTSWQNPAGMESRYAPSRGEEVNPTRRCWVDGITRFIEVTDVLDLVSLRKHVASDDKVVVNPAKRTPTTDHNITPSGGGEQYSLVGKSEGDLYNLKTYSPGDPVKSIVWRRQTSDGDYYVRLPENVESPRVCFAFLAGENDTHSAELARHVIENEPLEPNWGFVTSQDAELASSPQDALRFLAMSGNAPTTPAALQHGCERLAEALRRETEAFKVLFVPDAPELLQKHGERLLDSCDMVLCGVSSSANRLNQEPAQVQFIPMT